MCVKFLPMRSYPTRYTALLVSSVSYFLPSSSCRLVPFAIAGQVPFFFFVLSHTFFPQIWRDSSFGTVSQCRKHADEMDHLPYIIRRTLETRIFFRFASPILLPHHSLSYIYFF